MSSMAPPGRGQATLMLSPRRDSASYSQLLDEVVTEFPAERRRLTADSPKPITVAKPPWFYPLGVKSERSPFPSGPVG